MVDLLTRPPTRSTHTAPDRESWWERLTSIPVLCAGFVVLTLLAAGPLQSFDRALDEQWIRGAAPGVAPFLRDVLDRLAGQQVNLTVLCVVAIALAWRRLSWRPIVLGLATEAGFYTVGLMKLLFARPA